MKKINTQEDWINRAKEVLPAAGSTSLALLIQSSWVLIFFILFNFQFVNLINNTYRSLFIIKKKPAEKQAFI